jgi:uncharacterized protein
MSADAGTEANKALVRDFLAAMERRDADRIDALMTEDATYWASGKPHLFPLGGDKSKADFVAYMRRPSIFRDGLSIRIGLMTAEEDRVAVDAETDGIAPNGKRYNNLYHFLFFIRGGRVARVKEYMDTQHAAEVFLD